MKQFILKLLICALSLLCTCCEQGGDDLEGTVTDKKVTVKEVKYHPTLSAKPRYTYWLEIDGVW